MLTAMPDYYSASQFTGSTMSSETLSGSLSSRSSRVRTVRLVRPFHGTLPPPGLTCRHGPSLGFSIRGGREHGTGFFVSHVETGSEAHRQGLRVGDQIIRVNGFTVEDAVHKEVLQLVSNHTHVTLKVRSVGMIPVKDKKTDPLSWQIISDNSSSVRSSPQLVEKLQDVRISIMVAPRTKLGCGICKGPEWKPGIFVQFTKEGGIARDAGLRPGDQILFCNNVDFSDIPFNEAVNLMKSARQLDLIVRKSAGSELFPGESSGYNSSASSVTGDQSPSWSDSKRLSIVKEESLDLEDRLCQLKSKKWEKIEWDDVDAVEEKPYFKPTIINLSENGTTISNNGAEECQTKVENKNNSSSKLADICLISQQLEKKTVVVEVHRSDVTEEKNKTEMNLTKTSSVSSCNSLASSTASSSLSSAIAMELQRRSEKKKSEQDKPTIDEQLQIKKILKNVDTDKQQQHSKLMDEFKKAHRKMFKSADGAASLEDVKDNNNNADRQSGKQLSDKLQERLSSLSLKEAPRERSATLTRHSISGPVVNPPPPPPLPLNGSESIKPTNNTSSTCNSNTLNKPKKPKAPPVPIKTSTLSTVVPQPPPCPTPDYDNLSVNSTVSTLTRKMNGINNRTSQNVSSDMESLESFKLDGPQDVKPKPPNTYFNNNKKKLGAQLSNESTGSTATMRKQQRPVSVTIGEYPSGTIRRQPSRFDFLQNGGSNGGVDEVDKSPDRPISSQLASELAQTLNRSNLRKRTESMENLLNGPGPQINSQSNGTIRISLNGSTPTNLIKNFAKSTNDLSETGNNRVMININSMADKKTTEASPNGILKNGNGNHNIPSHRPVVHQKSITFGEMPTVINAYT